MTPAERLEAMRERAMKIVFKALESRHFVQDTLAEALVDFQAETARRCAEIAKARFKVGKDQMPLVIADDIRREFGIEDTK